MVSPASAASLNGVDFSDQPLPQIGSLSSTTYTNAFHAFDSGIAEYWFSALEDTDVYIVGYSSGDYYYFVLCSDVQSDARIAFEYRTSGTKSHVLSTYDSSSGLYYKYFSFSTANTTNINVPLYSDLASALAAVSDAVNAVSVVVLEPNMSYTFGTGYSVTNTSNVNVAVACKYDGNTYSSCIASRENLVLPGTSNSVSRNFSVSNSDSYTGLFYSVLDWSSGEPGEGVPVFPLLWDFLQAANTALSSSYVPQTNSINLGFYLEPGNVAYLNLTDLNVDISLSMTSSQYSADIPTYGSYFPGNQTYRFGASYPASGSDITFPISGSTNIPWIKDPDGARNIFGKTKSAVATLHPTANLVEIYNPFNYADDTGASYPTYVNNNKIWISVPGLARNGIRVYQLQDTFDPNTFWGITSDSPTNYSEYSDSQNDPSDQEDPGITGWNNQDGDDTTSPGPSSYNAPPENQGIADILSGFLSNITGLFTAGHDAIRNLTSGASEFISHLSGLYSWLPAPVLSVLTSAIIVAITIGVLKVFL